MKHYLAKDWRGLHIYEGIPKLLEHLPSFPPTFTGHKIHDQKFEPIGRPRLKSGEFQEITFIYSAC